MTMMAQAISWLPNEICSALSSEKGQNVDICNMEQSKNQLFRSMRAMLQFVVW